MGSNEEATQELQKKEENNDNSTSTTPSDEGSKVSNVSCVDNLSAIPKLKEMHIFIPCDENPHGEVRAEVVLKGLDVDDDVDDGDSGLNPEAEDEVKNDEDQVMVDVCTTEEGSTDGSLAHDENAVDVDVDAAEMTEAFSGVFEVSKVRELIESDPFIKEVVNSFLMHCDEKMKSEEQNGGINNNDNNACANNGGSSTLSVSGDVSVDVEAEMPQAEEF